VLELPWPHASSIISSDPVTPTKSRKSSKGSLPFRTHTMTPTRARHPSLIPTVPASHILAQNEDTHSRALAANLDLESGSVSDEDGSASGLDDTEEEQRLDFSSDTEVPTKVMYDSEESRHLKRRKLRSAGVHSSPSHSNPFSDVLTPDCNPASSGVLITPISIPLPAAKNLTTKAYVYSPAPPSTSELLISIEQYNIQSKVYRDPHYSKEIDAPEKPKEYAGLLYHLKGGQGPGILEEWGHEAGASISLE